MNTFHLDIITPERIAFSDEVNMVTVSSKDGVIGILPHHTPLFTRLVEGEVKITKGDEEIYLAIGGGFMEVTGYKVEILVTEAYHAHEINEQEVIQAKKRAEEALNKKPSGSELMEAQALFKRSTIALKIFGKRKHPRVS